MTAPNSLPIFTKTPDVQFSGPMTTGISTTDLTSATLGTSAWSAFTAGGQGSFAQRIRFRPVPQVSGATTATTARIWLNNGSTIATATNNTLLDEITLPATTPSNTSACVGYDLPLGFALPAGWQIIITLGTTSSNGWLATIIGGDY